MWSRVTSTSDYWLTRFVVLRLLGFIYLFAFLTLVYQGIPLIGENGLLPAENFLEFYGSRFDSRFDAFVSLPTLFWFHISDGLILALAWVGVVLSSVIIIGFANVPLLFLIWALYMSFDHIGQIWYGYGWEAQLLETSFIAIFMVPTLDPRPFPRTPPPVLIIWLLRWLAFRIYLGAGLIKIRGDECWRELTCLFYHYETQPIPNPLSPLFHFSSKAFHVLGVLWNHVSELVAPFFAFWPRRARLSAGVLFVFFQLFLILSGNLSFLNWLTIVPALACFDDGFLKRFLPRFITKRAEVAARNARPSRVQFVVSLVVVLAVGWLSIPVVQNLLSSRQLMNSSFNQLHIVNTYGAFGSVGKQRLELIVAGTSDEQITAETQWKEYQFKAKPGDPYRRLPIVAPYHYRVDWQIWFAAMSKPEYHPWLIHLIWQFLHNDPGALSLIAHNPFPDEPPRFIRVDRYQYSFVPPGDTSGAVWNRTYLGQWLPPLSQDTPELVEFIRANNWKP